MPTAILNFQSPGPKDNSSSPWTSNASTFPSHTSPRVICTHQALPHHHPPSLNWTCSHIEQLHVQIKRRRTYTFPSYTCVCVRNVEQISFQSYSGQVLHLLFQYFDDWRYGGASCSHAELESSLLLPIFTLLYFYAADSPFLNFLFPFHRIN